MAKTRTNGSAAAAAEHPGLTFPRTFTRDIPPGSVYDEVEWETRTAGIENTDGESVFRQEGIEVPKGWSQQATNIVADKYFRGNPGTDRARAQRAPARLPRRRHHHPVGRPTAGTSPHDDDREAFHDDLTYLLVHQKAAFNSPVWFNCRLGRAPASARRACPTRPGSTRATD